MIVDCAVYDDGFRRPGDISVTEALKAARESGSFTWIGLHEPTAAEFDEVRDGFGLHDLAVEDALSAHQRPKLEVYDGDLFLVLKTARYLDDPETVELAEIQVFVGDDYVVSVRHGRPGALDRVRRGLEADPDRLGMGTMAVLHGIVDRVVDDYGPVIAGLDNDIREIEGEVFDANRASASDASQRIYQLKREVLDLHRHTKPFVEPLGRLVACTVPRCDRDMAEYFRDVQDHLLRAVAEIEDFRDLLSDALDANLSQVSVRQNDDMRTISAWVAIGAVPTVVGAIYGMNFEHMPELGTRYGYPVVILVCVAACVTLHRKFRSAGWL